MFGMEDFESRAYDGLQESMKKLAVTLRVTLSALNFGQAFIRHISLAICLVLAAIGAQRGQLSPGDFVLIQAYVLQLFQPLAVRSFCFRIHMSFYRFSRYRLECTHSRLTLRVHTLFCILVSSCLLLLWAVPWNYVQSGSAGSYRR